MGIFEREQKPKLSHTGLRQFIGGAVFVIGGVGLVVGQDVSDYRQDTLTEQTTPTTTAVNPEDKSTAEALAPSQGVSELALDLAGLASVFGGALLISEGLYVRSKKVGKSNLS